MTMRKRTRLKQIASREGIFPKLKMAEASEETVECMDPQDHS